MLTKIIAGDILKNINNIESSSRKQSYIKRLRWYRLRIPVLSYEKSSFQAYQKVFKRAKNDKEKYYVLLQLINKGMPIAIHKFTSLAKSIKSYKYKKVILDQYFHGSLKKECLDVAENIDCHIIVDIAEMIVSVTNKKERTELTETFFKQIVHWGNFQKNHKSYFFELYEPLMKLIRTIESDSLKLNLYKYISSYDRSRSCYFKIGTLLLGSLKKQSLLKTIIENPRENKYIPYRYYPRLLLLSLIKNKKIKEILLRKIFPKQRYSKYKIPIPGKKMLEFRLACLPFINRSTFILEEIKNSIEDEKIKAEFDNIISTTKGSFAEQHENTYRWDDLQFISLFEEIFFNRSYLES
ncbi:hypothetical protein ACFL5G_05195 [Candidatus Margulisiibacteriota bacterium]